jgi:hypothetical protein
LIFSTYSARHWKTEKNHVLLWTSYILNWKWKVCLKQPATICLSNSNVDSHLLYCRLSHWNLINLSHRYMGTLFLIARLARSDPRNNFVVVVVGNFLPAVCSNFRVFRYVLISSPDMFKNHMNRNNSYHIESEQV